MAVCTPIIGRDSLANDTVLENSLKKLQEMQEVRLFYSEFPKSVYLNDVFFEFENFLEKLSITVSVASQLNGCGRICMLYLLMLILF